MGNNPRPHVQCMHFPCACPSLPWLLPIPPPQTVVDSVNSKKDDLRRARSGMVNLAPTSTGSATAITLIFPELKVRDAFATES